MTYCVIKKGIYIRQVWGPFSSDTHAAKFADYRATQEPDDHHALEVHVLDTPRGVGDHSEPIYSCKGQPRPSGDHPESYELEGGTIDGM